MPDLNDPNKLGSGKEMVERLTNVIAIFENPALDFQMTLGQQVLPTLGSFESGIPHVGRGIQLLPEGCRQRGNFCPGGLTRFFNFRRPRARVGHFIDQLCNHCCGGFLSRTSPPPPNRPPPLPPPPVDPRPAHTPSRPPPSHHCFLPLLP